MSDLRSPFLRLFTRLLLLAALPGLSAWSQSSAPAKPTVKASRTAKPKTDPVLTPKPGSDLRSDILDGLRERFESDLNRGMETVYRQRVRFFVRTLRVSGDWAFVSVRPIQRNGRWVNYPHSALAKAAAQKGFQDRVVSLLHRERRRYWKPVGYSVGAKGRVWDDWAKRHNAPQTLFP